MHFQSLEVDRRYREFFDQLQKNIKIFSPKAWNAKKHLI